MHIKKMHFHNAYPLFSKTYLSFFTTTSTLSPTPHITQETSTGTSKCSESQILSAPYYDIYEVLPTPINDEGDKCMVNTYDFTMPWEMTDDKVQSALTQFMVWASLTRDMEEMQKGKLICMRRYGCSCFASYSIHRAPLFACSLLSIILLDRELCDGDSDMPWSVQMCVVRGEVVVESLSCYSL